MATYYAVAAGNFNATSTWSTTPAGAAGFGPPIAGDTAVANGRAVAITASATCLELRNDNVGGATVGGTFTLNSGVTLTANVLQNNTTGGGTLVSCTYASPLSASIVGNVTTPTNTSGNIRTINITGTGTLNFTGNATGDNRSSAGGGSISLSAGCIVNFVGNAYGGTGIGGQAIEIVSSVATLNITGNAYGGGGAAIYNAANGTANITGTSFGSITTGAGSGATNASTGTINVTRVVGSGYGPGSSGIGAAVGAANSGLGVIQVEEIEFGALGMSPTSGGGIRLKKLTNNVAKFNYCDTVGSKTLVDATQGQMPAITDVRFGTSYASGALTGSAYIPAAGSVAFGVPTDNTTGTATLTAANVRAAIGMASANLDTQLAAIPTAITNADAVRTNLATELGRIDATISSRSTLTAANVRTELTPELTEIGEIHAIHGLDIANALTVTPTLRSAGAITQAITGDGTTSTIVTRV